MKNFRKIFVLAILIGSVNFIYAQDFATLKGEADAAFMEGRNEEAIVKFKQLIKMEGADSADYAMVYAYAGLCSKSLGNVNDALTYLHKSLEYNVKRSMIYDQMISIAETAGNEDEFEFAMVKKMTDFPNSKDEILNTLVNRYYKSKSYVRLEKYTIQLLEKEPNHKTFLLYDAIAKQNIDKSDAAIISYKKILAMDPNNANANMGIGMILYEKAKNMYEGYKADYEKIKTPSRVDYSNFTKKLDEPKKIYQSAIPYLEKAYNSKYKSLKGAIKNSYLRIGDKVSAEKYN